jgi:hypothetical protein
MAKAETGSLKYSMTYLSKDVEVSTGAVAELAAAQDLKSSCKYP